MKWFKKNHGGVVLLTVICLMSMLIVVLMSAIVIVSASNKKSVLNYTDNQVYATAKSSLDTFMQCLEDGTMTEFDGIRSDMGSLSVGTPMTVSVTLPSGESDEIVIEKDASGEIIVTAKSDYQGNQTTVSRKIEMSSSIDIKDTDIIFVFDTSNSMSDADKSLAVNAVKDFAKKLLVENDVTRGHVRIGLAKFDTKSAPILPLTDINTTIQNKLNELNVLGKVDTGGTNIQVGINKAEVMLNNVIDKADQQFIIILGDGVPTYCNYIKHLSTDISIPTTFSDWTIKGLGWSYTYECDYYEDNNDEDAYDYNVIYRTYDNVLIENNGTGTIAEAENARLKGYKIMTIGFGLNNIDDNKRPESCKMTQATAIETLTAVADSESYFFEADKTADSLQGILDQVIGAISSSVTATDYVYTN